MYGFRNTIPARLNRKSFERAIEMTHLNGRSDVALINVRFLQWSLFFAMEISRRFNMQTGETKDEGRSIP
jgi:hypothetical protein